MRSSAERSQPNQRYSASATGRGRTSGSNSPTLIRFLGQTRGLTCFDVLIGRRDRLGFPVVWCGWHTPLVQEWSRNQRFVASHIVSGHALRAEALLETSTD